MVSKPVIFRSISRSALLISAGCGAASPSLPPRPVASADLVIVHADVRTMDAAHPHATAIAITGSTITYVGDDATAFIGPHTDVHDLRGNSVTPGLVDAHCHVYGLGTDLESIDLRGLASEKAAAAAVIEGAKRVPAGEWVLGRGWDQNRWAGQLFPSHDTIDAIDRPVVLTRIDGHAIWVNNAALKAAGITSNTPNAEGGKIVRRSNAPTGVFVDLAMALVVGVMPKATVEVRERRLRNATVEARCGRVDRRPRDGARARDDRGAREARRGRAAAGPCLCLSARRPRASSGGFAEACRRPVRAARREVLRRRCARISRRPPLRRLRR